MEGFGTVQTASVSEFKSKLSGYLKLVKTGQEVIVFERGKAIARVVPYEEAGPSPGRIQEMIRTGQIIPASHPTPPRSDRDPTTFQASTGQIIPASHPTPPDF